MESMTIVPDDEIVGECSTNVPQTRNSFVVFNKKLYEHVYQVTMNTIKEDDWLLVQFCQVYIGKVLTVSDGEFEGTFLRSKPSKKCDYGSLFVYPNVRDECQFAFSQIVGRIDPPI